MSRREESIRFFARKKRPFPRVRSALYRRFCLPRWLGTAGSCSSSSLKQYLEFEHVLVEIREGQQALVDRALSQLGAKRRVALTLPFFVPAIFAIANTDLILTVPRRLAKITAVMAGARVVEAPREIKAFPYFMTWHPRLTNEPAHQWFHEQLRLAVRTV